MRRRGFTLLETILAAVIGSLVLLACAGLFGLLDRSDRRLGARFEDVMAMERLRSAVARAMDTLVMSTEPQPPGSDGRGLSDAPAEGATRPPPPRFVLEPDLSPSLTGVLRRANIAGKDGAAPQRFEVVLARSPVPPRGPRVAAPEHGRRAVRGVFELRPDRRKEKDHGSYAVKGDEAGWTLWWRPLSIPDGRTTGEPGGNDGDTRWMDPADDPAATELITGLERCQWTVYVKREKQTQYAAVWALALPAYVELSVKTTAGVTARWMFEVGWSNAPEIVEDPRVPEPGGEQPAAGDESAGPAGGNATGEGVSRTTTTPRRITPAGRRPINN
jgi:prepilin-type N-terminal cleavage/methylation domain-containing protein